MPGSAHGYRAGVPESAEPPSTWRPVEAVLLDFHGTIAQVEDPVRWVTSAASSLGTALDRGRATVLADRLTTAGRAGGPKPHRVPAHLAEVWADRDLSVAAHRAAYEGLAATVDADLAEALYDRLLMADGWQLYADTIPTLQALRARGIPVAVVSNIGFDLRDLAGQLGFADLVDEFVLSYEVGRCKPDPAIFWKACAALRTDPERTLMVGDSPADAGAAAAGCSVLVLPESDPGKVHGLSAVLRLL
ncbi:HAD family hydrolase [Dactylosporangium siamense]|uniref:HAD family hydrolase n=1 Tax=Dactylosporangium siamense TaxID=685454 RepID=UPI0019447494|nr:HAD-IA family hydrolase [Dactylosporangium siamense]